MLTHTDCKYVLHISKLHLDTATGGICELSSTEKQTGAEAHGTVATGKGLLVYFCFLPSASLILCGASLLSTFRGAGSAQADEYGHVPISSESTGKDKERYKEERKGRLKGKRDPYRSKKVIKTADS